LKINLARSIITGFDFALEMVRVEREASAQLRVDTFFEPGQPAKASRHFSVLSI